MEISAFIFLYFALSAAGRRTVSRVSAVDRAYQLAKEEVKQFKRKKLKKAAGKLIKNGYDVLKHHQHALHFGRKNGITTGVESREAALRQKLISLYIKHVIGWQRQSLAYRAIIAHHRNIL